MNCFELHAMALRRCVCDNCGFPIEPGEDYYELPDGYCICDESDCLREWAAGYRRRLPMTPAEEDLT